MGKRILLVEDDKPIARLLQDNLAFDGFEVAWSTGHDALQLSKQFVPDLILLDLMLPHGVDGFELCQRFSQDPKHVPVIILSARSERADRVRGLTLGADDYIVKPFALDELLARIKAVLRRTTPRLRELQLGETTIDFQRLKAFTGTGEIGLTDREFEILRCLAERAGSIVSRDELLRRVWGYTDAAPTRTVDNFIFRLRQKLERDPHRPQYIRTVYGDGYRLAPSD